MADLAKLVVRMEAQTAKFQKDLARAEKRVDKFKRSAKKSFSAVQAAAGALALGAITKKVIDSTAKQEQAYAQLVQGIESTNKAVGYSAQELSKYAAELQKATTFGDEDIIAAQAQLVSFTSIAGEQFQKTTELALDLSTRFGTDLKSSVLQLGKALNDPVTNLSALSRAGIQFSDDQKKLVKSLVETGRLTEAQNLILKELETQFGGSARAARDTFGGALQGLGNTLGDLLESDTGLTAAKEEIESLTNQLSDPKTKQAAQELTSILISGFSDLVSIMAQVPDFARWLGESIARAIHGPDSRLGKLEDRLEVVRDKLKDFYTNQNGQLIGVQTAFGFTAATEKILNKFKSLTDEAKEIEEKMLALQTELAPPTLNLNSSSGEPTQTPSAATTTPPVVNDVFNNVQQIKDTIQSIVDTTTPQLEKLKSDLGEVNALEAFFGTPEQFDQAKAYYETQIAEIENSEQVAFDEKLLRMEENFLSEQDLLATQMMDRLMFVQEGLNNELIAEEDATKAKLKIIQKYRDDKAKIEKAAAQAEMKQALIVAHGVLGILSAFAGKSVKAQKALAIAEGIINITAGVTKALNNPYPANLGFAAQVASQGAALINTIKGVSLGATGNVGLSTGGSAAFSTPSAVSEIGQVSEERRESQPESQAIIQVMGDINSNDAPRLLEDLKELINNNDVTLIETDSRNGQDLIAANSSGVI